MVHEGVESWLPLRGRWLGYFWRGLLRGLLAWCLVWTLGIVFGPRSFLPVPKGQVGAARTQIGNFKTALELYRMDHGGKVPTTRQGLLTLIRPPANGSDPHWKGPYLNDVTSVPLDPWRHPYVYASPGPHGEPYLVLCYGADGKAGGSDEAEDLSNIKR